MRDEEEATDGPPDPRLHPERSPGFGEHPGGLAAIEVDRDVTIGEASPEELSVSDTTPVADRDAEALCRTLEGGSVVERRRAALALADAGADDGRVGRALAGAASDDDPEVRQFAVESLGKRGGEVAADAARRLVDDPDPWVRAEAVVTLDRLDRAAHRDRIEDALDDDHHAARRNATISLFKLRGEGALDVLLERADDPSERVREWAVHLLGGVDDDRARVTLDAAAESDESDLVRATAARALEVDPGSFRRQFSGALDEEDTVLPGEDALNRRPDL
ncbi:HEAT repeat domain-containing protein [Halomarina pelagica]|uniref:HEAT repeat domain-containing protein n=1 Tax=Halomarina pelagica TaxID=2961599 RepID=UPI0020C27BE5|nr:HEAT repeat domain-containing protein [Halomarina sp. BND7]